MTALAIVAYSSAGYKKDRGYILPFGGIDALTAATQYAEAEVALVRTEQPLQIELADSSSWGTGEAGRLVAEAMELVPPPHIGEGSVINEVMILCDISRPLYDSGVNVNPHVAAALVRELYSLDSSLVITLGAAPEYWPGAAGFLMSGFNAMVAGLKAELPGLHLSLADLNEDSTRLVDSNVEVCSEDIGGFQVSRRVADVPYRIVLAKLSTGNIGLKCTFNALRQALPGSVNGYPRFADVPAELLDETLTSLGGAVRADYVLVDALNCLEGAGRADYEAVRGVGAILAGADLVAVDAIAARFAGFDPRDMEYLELAQDATLGVMDYDRLATVGNVSLPEGRIPLAKPARGYSDKVNALEPYLYQGQGLRKMLYYFSAATPEEMEPPVLPYPGLEDWIEPEFRSPDEPLGPCDSLWQDAEAVYAFSYYDVDEPADVQLWAGVSGPIEIFLNGEKVYSAQNHEMQISVPEVIWKASLPAGCGTIEVWAKLSEGVSPSGMFTLNLVADEDDAKFTGSRSRDLRYFVNPAGNQSYCGLLGTAGPGMRVEAYTEDGKTHEAYCGARGRFVLRELFRGDTEVSVYDSAGNVVADTLIYLEEWENTRLDINLGQGGAGCPEIRGDYSGDSVLAINDVIALLLGMRAEPSNVCYDFSGDGAINIADAISLLLYIRAGQL